MYLAKINKFHAKTKGTDIYKKNGASSVFHQGLAVRDYFHKIDQKQTVI